VSYRTANAYELWIKTQEGGVMRTKHIPSKSYARKMVELWDGAAKYEGSDEERVTHFAIIEAGADLAQADWKTYRAGHLKI